MLTGDFSALTALSERLGAMAASASHADEAAAEAIQAQLERQYQTGTDPSGQPWAPLKPSTLASGRKPPPLTATGSMRGRSLARPVKGVQVTIPSPGGYHQSGTSKMAARHLVPDGDTLPQPWREALIKSVTASIRGAR